MSRTLSMHMRLASVVTLDRKDLRLQLVHPIILLPEPHENGSSMNT